LRRLLDLFSLKRTRLPEPLGLGVSQALQGMAQDLQLGAGAKQVDAWRRGDLSVVSIDELKVRLEAIDQHLQLLPHDVPAGRLQNTVLGRHQDAIVEVGPTARKAVNGQFLW
jgi:hypothetical protein